MKSPNPTSRNLTCLALAALAVVLGLAWHLWAQPAPKAAPADWHQFLGPDRNGISLEKDWLAEWPEGGPKVLWSKEVGVGWSAVSVSRGRLYTMGNSGDKDTVWCFDADKGKLIWKKSYPCPAGDKPGTRCTPTVDGDRVYTLSREGHIICFGAAKGKPIWNINARTEFNTKPPQWGFACSPLVMDDWLIVDVGVVVALNKKTGKAVWRSQRYTAGYASPIAFKLDKKPCLAIFNKSGLVILDAANGKELRRMPWKTEYDVNAATPIIVGPNRLFISSGYGTGCALVEIGKDRIKTVWRNREMRNHFSTCVLYQGHLYGVDGNVGGASFKCLDLKDGSVKWTYGRMGMGSLMLADAKLIGLTDRGQLFTGPASANGFKPLARATVVSGQCWTMPVLSGGKIYCRSREGNLVCVDVSKKK